ncbi:MAG TPA: alpha/beta fold hydrolase [Archangium sp.]|uniref:thioesterase II family protein n=1 Tax=Archangium sp. TaxID=1872627 RepID=UPI002E33C995|nr:alpha/beta fold hydrolase [Archangium sp.]HEX5751154.1 alpha/beta fold hydrolase [Archangium sp.]
MTRTSPWLACRLRRPDARVRLFCFPHSGGSAGEYLRWADLLENVEVWGVQLPGRGARTEEPPLTRVSVLVDALADALVDALALGPPFAFFGHSLGALVAFETARRLRDLGRAPPAWLFLSAYPAPQLPSRTQPTSHLGEAPLLDALERMYGDMAAEIREDAELRELLLPPLRADLALVESYRYQDGEPLDCEMVITGGTQDDLGPDALEPWRRHTRGTFRVHLLPGGHFYLRAPQQRDTLLRLLDATLRPSHTSSPKDLHP